MTYSKIFRGVIWASIQRFGNLGISFVSNMVLARLLTPGDFGTIGMLMFFIAMAQTFVDSGFGAALIQKKVVTLKDVNTVFFINMGMSVFTYIVLFCTAPVIADFYNIPLLCNLLRVQSLVILIQGFTLIQTVQLQKSLNFKRLSICNLAGSVTLVVTGIVAALLGYGVWSLAIRVVCGTFVTSALLWAYSSWKPSFIFSKDSFKQLFGFGGFMLLSSIMISISNNIQAMILGKMFKTTTVGNFTQARTLRNIPSESVSTVIGQVLFPDFSNHQNDDLLIKQKLEKSAYLISYVVSCVMALCILVGEPLIKVVYGGQWDEAIPYFQILCLGGLPICLQDININVIKAKGHSLSLFICNFIKITLYVILMILGAKIMGIYGFIWVMVVYSFISYLVFALIGNYYINNSILGQLLKVGKSIGFAIAPMVVVYAIRYILTEYPNHFIWLIAESFLYITFFIMLSAVLKCEAYLYLCNNLKAKRG